MRETENLPKLPDLSGEKRTGNEAGNKIAINCTAIKQVKIFSAINCNFLVDDSQREFSRQEPPSSIDQFVRDSLSENTRRAYHFDLEHFAMWGAQIPSTPERIAHYIADLAETHTAATISRRLAALSKAHRACGLDDPTKAEIVKATLRGIRRKIGTAQQEAKPILREDLFAMLERIDDDPKGRRDKALLLIGFAGAFRRSELVSLSADDIEHVRQGIVVTLRRSKTDQTGAGRKIGIPFGRTRWCPVNHLTEWLEHAGIMEGPIFRPVAKGGRIAEQRLSGEAVNIVVKSRAEAAGIEPERLSGHSLRAGLATSAAMAGAATHKIRAQTGHSSEAMLMRYIRDGDIFESNATASVL